VLARVAIAFLVSVPATAAQEPAIDWSRTPVSGGVVLPGGGPNGTPGLQLRAPSSGASFHLVTIDHPPVAGPAFRVAGDVRYEGVEGQGYVEMWTMLPNGARYFTRTLAPAGPLETLHGDSKWRRFELPFQLGDSGPAPARLEINVVLPGGGTVWIGPLRLEQSSAQMATTEGGWWSERSGGLYGAILGSSLGVLGAIIGVLGGSGKARRLVLALLAGMVVGGGCAVLVAAAAAFTAQPRHVWYPLLLLGGLSAVVGLVVGPALRRRYAADELRRIQAMDARARP